MHATTWDNSPARSLVADRIVVGVEVNPGGLAALAWATEEATARDGHLTLCHARRDGDPHGAAPDLNTLQLTQPDLVRYIRQTRQKLGGGNVAVELPRLDAATALLQLGNRADLLVIGGPHTIDPLHLSVPARLAAHAPCPVVVVRPVRGYDGGPFAGHVVVGVDGSRGCAAALRIGFTHAARHHLPLTAVYVDDRRPGDYWFDDHFLETHFATDPAALQLLARDVEPVAAQFPRVTVKRAVYGGDPVAGLRRAAVGATLLVLGRHGNRMPAPLRLGSVSRAFAEQAECVVAIVPDSISTTPAFSSP